MTFPLGERIELQHDGNVIRQEQRLDLGAQAAQAQCDYRLAQLGRAGDVSLRRIDPPRVSLGVLSNCPQPTFKH
jgi:hypothetical protein